MVARLRRLDILVGSDDPECCDSVSTLAGTAHLIRVASSLAQTRSAAAIAAPDVLVIDLQLGRGELEQLVQEVALVGEVRRVLIARAGDEVSDLVERNVVHAVLRKPWSRLALHEALGPLARRSGN